MRFLADENIPADLVAWLRTNGHDVIYAAEVAPGEHDDQWLQRAESEQRIVFTSDKDFGDLVFRDKLTSHGVVLLRLFNMSNADRVARLEKVWSLIEANHPGFFVVVTASRVRVRRVQ